MPLTSIPTVDLSEFTSGDSVRKNRFIRELGTAYEEIGFVTVTNHGLTQELRENLYEQVEQFFALDENIKLKYHVDGLAGQRGYTPFGKEHAKGHNAGDLKEFFQFGQNMKSDPHEGDDYPLNVNVSELPQFNPTAMTAYKTLEAAGSKLLQAIALYLKLDEHYFDAKIHDGNSILRAIHYPPITEEPKDAVRAAEHEDINLITLLMGASAEGLEVKTKEGKWLAVNVAEDAIVVNVGDMLQRLTNNVLRSTTHRVVNPPKEKWGKSRFSIPFFLHPVAEMDLTCLDSCITEENPKGFEDTTAGEYLDERLREIGLK
ncbi:MAG: isopenicillin N synthase family oxygenase [Bacteroidetes bacterium]|uniref:Isopenicillin N synthase family oxygenase n=1 Tax=Phaeocystidibacter marisrubri TaxID=1577780 RepID=A0A6L3ZKP7_9FLAO|nr:2-oxoglutarate and iron-dependent oxygenase domain-containing protein [Phaeocystidibacter marisrubri]KAB2818035.1 isopenicillin N synthase family oxygenase [Phaeocystidibacter marisrubri]TNE26125.1 MAG: isopenicillin N synthase family oxygenase [Bacteroidota bacterium]GGH72279.1 flavonol synthase [Phaeocystidibacter marisrubri]